MGENGQGQERQAAEAPAGTQEDMGGRAREGRDRRVRQRPRRPQGTRGATGGKGGVQGHQCARPQQSLRQPPPGWPLQVSAAVRAEEECNGSSDSTQIIHQCDQNFNDSHMYISAVNFPLVFMFSVRRQMSPVSARRVAFVFRDFPIGFI